ncbi:hypothetical protein [Streptomyces sp. NBC_01618]|uniref:hypothetical protein n=1 Tax=Streptomyces sp. NBC_01618 TaxID=2975900 RepID=UPI0038670A82|nr:hypothetical protein OH735_08550 [Streptomyces sp. NBC_01618]
MNEALRRVRERDTAEVAGTSAADGQEQQPPKWLEDFAHEQLLIQTRTRLRAAADAAAAVDRLQSGRT